MPTWKPKADGGYQGEGFGADVELVKLAPKRWVLRVNGTDHPITSKRPTFDHAEKMLGEILPQAPKQVERPIQKETSTPKKVTTGRVQAIIPRLPRFADPLVTLNRSRQDAIALAYEKGIKETHGMLQRAQRELNARLRRITSTGAGEGSFSEAQVKQALAQVKATIANLRPALKTGVLDMGEMVGTRASEAAIQYMQEAQQAFTGINQRLPIKEASILDRAVRGTEASILQRLETDPQRGPGILDRYGDAVVKKFEERLQQRFLQGKTWEDTQNDLISDSSFLQKEPAHWVERIVRTELMGAHNTANFATIQSVEQEVGGMLKILCATFDSRTSSDSYAVHGQIRRPDEAFEDWHHAYQHPPNRPNDREVVVPHNMRWPIPANLMTKSDAEVAMRWAQEKRKGSPPPRPRMSTVPLDTIGRET